MDRRISDTAFRHTFEPVTIGKHGGGEIHGRQTEIRSGEFEDHMDNRGGKSEGLKIGNRVEMDKDAEISAHERANREKIAQKKPAPVVPPTKKEILEAALTLRNLGMTQDEVRKKLKESGFEVPKEMR